MNLAERLQIQDPCDRFGRKYCFRIGNGRYKEDYYSLINHVLNRFARRFGNIKNEDAKVMQERLAYKYNGGHYATLSKLKNNYICGFSYPDRDAYWQSNEMRNAELIEKQKKQKIEQVKQASLEWVKYELEIHYDNPSGDYCLIQSKYLSFCEICGSRTNYTIKKKTGKEVCIEGVYLHGNYVCKSKKCRAVSVIYKNHRDVTTQLINAILDSVKNNEKHAQLRKHFI